MTPGPPRVPSKAGRAKGAAQSCESAAGRRQFELCGGRALPSASCGLVCAFETYATHQIALRARSGPVAVSWREQPRCE